MKLRGDLLHLALDVLGLMAAFYHTRAILHRFSISAGNEKLASAGLGRVNPS